MAGPVAVWRVEQCGGGNGPGCWNARTDPVRLRRAGCATHRFACRSPMIQGLVRVWSASGRRGLPWPGTKAGDL